ncbi:MAG TPA: FAD-binding protein [Pyrodictiaceae archaeon]|nr:FAD-binding protein [Pyrodictiaceae archaeon]
MKKNEIKWIVALIIGAGGAGLYAALSASKEAKDLSIAVLTN